MFISVIYVWTIMSTSIIVVLNNYARAKQLNFAQLYTTIMSSTIMREHIC